MIRSNDNFDSFQTIKTCFQITAIDLRLKTSNIKCLIVQRNFQGKQLMKNVNNLNKL